MTVMNMVQAINSALMQEMEADGTVVVLGEDVGIDGGVFRVTDGLLKKFPNRVIDTPLAELAIAGTSVGMAVYGLKPVAEIQFDGFSPPILDQIICHAGRIRWRTSGRYHAPLVIRIPYGGGIKALEHHSDSPEAYFVHTPGIKVVVPSTPYEAKGLLASSIRDPDPVIFLEPKRIYRAIKEDVPDEPYTIPLGEAKIVREGEDVTLISYGAMTRTCKQVMEKSRHSIEIIDVRTLSPLDTKTIIESVKKTGRAVIVHEAPKSCGFGAELAAVINDKDLLHLKAPVTRVTGFDTVMPLPKLEEYYIPSAERIEAGIEKVMEF